MTDKIREITGYLKECFAGDPAVKRYFAPDRMRFVDILRAPHEEGITHLGTVGCFERRMKGLSEDLPDVRAELVTAVDDRFAELMAETLAGLTFRLDDEVLLYHPNVLIENAIPGNDLTEMRHIYFCHPFLWVNKIPRLQFDEYNVVFLYALPISDPELKIFKKYGALAFEDLLQNNEIRYNDLTRRPVQL